MIQMVMVYLAVFAVWIGTTSPVLAQKIEFNDPKQDDHGPGTYTYPTHSSYRKGDFDITKVTLEAKGSDVEIRVTVRNRIRDVWQSKTWGGNGFSVQFAQLYISTGTGKGWSHALPGLNVRFAKTWNKVVLISPQGFTRLKQEINLKAEKFKPGIVLPTTTRSSGKTLIAVVPKSALGGFDTKWGFQLIMQSNEGYPDKADFLTRRVNEYNGEHRFGGGNDGVCDPHVIDMLAGDAKGATSEIKAQHKALAHDCSKNKLAVVPFVYKK